MPAQREGFGLNVVDDSWISNPLYQRLLQYSECCDVDGIIVGGTKVDIINRISSEKKLPIYSPGLGIQGGDPKTGSESRNGLFHNWKIDNSVKRLAKRLPGC